MDRIASATAKTAHVFIRNLEMLAHIGVHGHEQGKLQPVRINVDLGVREPDVPDDKLEHVVDYEAVAERIRALVGRGHVNLAETLARRIVEMAFEDARVTSVRVRVEKLHALPGAESGGVEIERIR
ncbi:MAG TPA: dihydroneopterin aldolase [Rhizomicrobium sp.]|nr:dihydroneopterin aldolase [Rhizomicrobium sp.]